MVFHRLQKSIGVELENSLQKQPEIISLLNSSKWTLWERTETSQYDDRALSDFWVRKGNKQVSYH